MMLAGRTLANPTEIQVVPFSLVAANLTMSGIKAQKLLRYWGSDVFPAGEPIRGFRFHFSWTNLSKAEYDDIEAAFIDASLGYVELYALGLAVSFDGVDSTYYVTVDPQDTVLKNSWQQAYSDGDPTPVIYDAEASFIGATYWDRS